VGLAVARAPRRPDRRLLCRERSQDGALPRLARPHRRLRLPVQANRPRRRTRRPRQRFTRGCIAAVAVAGIA